MGFGVYHVNSLRIQTILAKVQIGFPGSGKQFTKESMVAAQLPEEIWKILEVMSAILEGWTALPQESLKPFAANGEHPCPLE